MMRVQHVLLAVLFAVFADGVEAKAGRVAMRSARNSEGMSEGETTGLIIACCIVFGIYTCFHFLKWKKENDCVCCAEEEEEEEDREEGDEHNSEEDEPNQLAAHTDPTAYTSAPAAYVATNPVRRCMPPPLRGSNLQQSRRLTIGRAFGMPPADC